MNNQRLSSQNNHQEGGDLYDFWSRQLDEYEALIKSFISQRVRLPNMTLPSHIRAEIYRYPQLARRLEELDDYVAEYNMLAHEQERLRRERMEREDFERGSRRLDDNRREVRNTETMNSLGQSKAWEQHPAEADKLKSLAAGRDRAEFVLRMNRPGGLTSEDIPLAFDIMQRGPKGVMDDVYNDAVSLIRHGQVGVSAPVGSILDPESAPKVEFKVPKPPVPKVDPRSASSRGLDLLESRQVAPKRRRIGGDSDEHTLRRRKPSTGPRGNGALTRPRGRGSEIFQSHGSGFGRHRPPTEPWRGQKSAAGSRGDGRGRDNGAADKPLVPRYGFQRRNE